MQLLTPATPQVAQDLADRLGARARFIAGGTVIQQEWEGSRLAPDDACLIDLQRWPQTQGIALEGHSLRIGAGARLETVRTDALVRAHVPLLVQALDQLGALGVRRLGTLGGNVGWGMGDAVPVLLVLDAEAELADGSRVPLAEVLARPALPLLVAFHLPRADTREPLHAVFEKVGYRAAFSPARLRMALRWRSAERGRDLIRVAAGAPGAPVRRLAAVEALLSPDAPCPDLYALRRACAQTLPPSMALIASRLIAGHCGLL